MIIRITIFGRICHFAEGLANYKPLFQLIIIVRDIRLIY